MNKSTKKAIVVGAGALTAAALAASAAYLLTSDEHKAKAKAWVMKAKHEVAKNIQAVKHLTVDDYTRLVNEAVKRYGTLQNATGPEIVQAARELKAEWKKIQSHAGKVQSSVKKAVKPKARSAHKKTKKSSSK